MSWGDSWASLACSRRENLTYSLPPDPLGRRFETLIGVHPHGNVDPAGDPRGELQGQNVLRLSGQPEGLSPEDREVLRIGERDLKLARSKRPRPHRVGLGAESGWGRRWSSRWGYFRVPDGFSC